MSIYERGKIMKSKVMTIANHLVKQGMSRSAAMVRAWITVKLRRIETRTAGVMWGNRQQLLARLARYSPDEITIELHREHENLYDSNAIKVVAGVKGKGKAALGYINRTLAAAIAPLLDKGKEIRSSFKAVTGGNEYFLHYGLNLAISI